MKTRDIQKILTYIVLISGSFVMMYPLIYGFLGSFVTTEEYYNSGILPFPKSFSWDRFDTFILFFKSSRIINSLGITVARIIWHAVISVFVAILGGYAFSKIKFKGREKVFFAFMSSMMIPGVAMMIPTYIMMARFPLVGGNGIDGQGGSGFLNTPEVLFIMGLVSVYNIFLVRQTLFSIGDEYKEAAAIDGAGIFTIIFRIYMLMIKPVLVVIVINCFIGTWNDYMTPFIYVPGNAKAWPIGLAAVRLANDYLYGGNPSGLPNYPAVFAISIMTMIPPIAMFLVFQKQFVKGMAAGGIKG
jgi:multiple sugar transport system permease protein